MRASVFIRVCVFESFSGVPVATLVSIKEKDLNKRIDEMKRKQVCVRACMHACVRACVCACVRACVCVCVITVCVRVFVVVSLSVLLGGIPHQLPQSDVTQHDMTHPTLKQRMQTDDLSVY